MQSGTKVVITKGNTLYEQGEKGEIVSHQPGKEVHADPCRGVSGSTLLVKIAGQRQFYVPETDLSAA